MKGFENLMAYQDKLQWLIFSHISSQFGCVTYDGQKQELHAKNKWSPSYSAKKDALLCNTTN